MAQTPQRGRPSPSLTSMGRRVSTSKSGSGVTPLDAPTKMPTSNQAARLGIPGGTSNLLKTKAGLQYKVK